MRKQLGWGNFRKDFWDCSWPIADRRVPSNNSRDNCGTVSSLFLTWCIYSFHMTSRWPSWCTEEILWGLNSFPMKKLSFRLRNLHSCRPREWKRSIACNDRKLLIPTWRCMMDRVLMLARVRQWVYPAVEENKTVIKHKQRTRICFDWLISTRVKSWTNGCLWITAHEGLLQGRKIIAEDRGFKQPLTINAKNYSIVTSLDDFYGTMLANGVDKKIASSVSVRLSRYKVDRKYKESTKAV